MGRRRRDDDFEGPATAIAVLLLILLLAVIAFWKLIVLVLAIGTGIALACFLLYRFGRKLWERQVDISAYLPQIDWKLPPIPDFDTRWLNVHYPDFTARRQTPPAHVMGTSGAWKEVVKKLERFPSLCGAPDPPDVQRRVRAYEAAAGDILRQALVGADEVVRQRRTDLEQQIQQLRESERTLVRRVQPQLEELASCIEALAAGSLRERLKAKRILSCLRQYADKLGGLRQEVRERAHLQEQSICTFLDAGQRERTVRDWLQHDLAEMKAVVSSKEFAGARAEVAVIQELARLNDGSLVFNDVSMVADRYIHFEGKPLQSAQIDTLVITTSGVFVIEVKNWSREFAHSGEGFNPYEQVSRAGYLVFDRLRSAGMEVKVRSIIATNGDLPQQEKQKVAVVPIRRLRKYIERAPDRGVDVLAVRLALGF